MTNNFDGEHYLHGGKIYGKMFSQETICKQLKRIKDMKDLKGVEQRFFLNSLGIVKIKFGNKWWDYHKLAEHFEDLDITKPLNV